MDSCPFPCAVPRALDRPTEVYECLCTSVSLRNLEVATSLPCTHLAPAPLGPDFITAPKPLQSHYSTCCEVSGASSAAPKGPGKLGAAESPPGYVRG